MATEVKDIRITDPYTKARLEEVRRIRGDATITKTATRLVLERVAQLETQGVEVPALATRTRVPSKRPTVQ